MRPPPPPPTAVSPAPSTSLPASAFPPALSPDLADLPPLPAQWSHLGNNDALAMAIRVGMEIGMGMGAKGGVPSSLDIPLSTWLGSGSTSTPLDRPVPPLSRQNSNQSVQSPSTKPDPTSTLLDDILCSPPFHASTQSGNPSRRDSKASESNPSSATSTSTSPVTGFTSPSDSQNEEASLDRPLLDENDFDTPVWKLYQKQKGELPKGGPRVENLAWVRSMFGLTS